MRVAGRAALERAIAAGDVVRVARGRYALAGADEAVVAAHRLGGVASHTSAALLHGWKVKVVPARPHVAVAKNRVLTPARVRDVDLHRLTLGPDDVDSLVTSRERTLVDCLRTLPFDEALCIADSALRDGFNPSTLDALARDARGPGSAQVRKVARHADGRARPTRTSRPSGRSASTSPASR